MASVETVRTILDEWDDYVVSHAQGTVFHTSRWQRLIQSAFGHEPQHLVARDGKTIVGLLPLFLVRSRIFGRMLISTPQAAYGGILADSDEIHDVLLRRAQQLADHSEVRFLELRDRIAGKLPTRDLYVTFRQELFPHPEKNFLRIPRKTRAECREGIRHGLEFKADAIDVERFYAIYSRSVRDLGTPVFSRRLFAIGKDEFGERCKIFSVHWQGKPVAAVWTLLFKDEVLPYYGGSLRAYNRLAVNNFMYWMLMKWGSENGYRIFDFGRSKKGTGSFDFKKRWGMVMNDLPYQYYLVRDKTLPDTSPLNPKFSLPIRIWRRLPLPFANALGPAIARHLV